MNRELRQSGLSTAKKITGAKNILFILTLAFGFFAVQSTFGEDKTGDSDPPRRCYGFNQRTMEEGANAVAIQSIMGGRHGNTLHGRSTLQQEKRSMC